MSKCFACRANVHHDCDGWRCDCDLCAEYERLLDGE